MTVLRQRMTEDMQVRNLSPHTQASYLQQVSLFARYFRTSPDALTPEHIRTYQIYLTNEKKLAANSIHTAVAALRFLYRITLKKDWTFGEDIPLPKKPHKLPVVLSPEEVVHFLNCVDCRKHRVILTICYAAGLRISEAVRLKIAAIDSARMVVRVEQGKGRKDRYVMLSPRLLEILRNHWRAVRPKEWLFPGVRDDRPITKDAVEAACQEGAPFGRSLQTCHAAFVATRIRSPSPRIRHRSADHSTSAWSSQPRHYRQVLAHRDQQGLRNIQSSGPVAASGSR